ncbi:MAG: class I SAM-dependent methyltransferase [Solirubrobacteraceae bacterium MAG38_C4-C5]|nr:class I SAM-dependent methyltransferase [Candidatus Siliceabacter maunaloa]
MTAATTDPYREAVWEGVPPGAPPERFERRRRFLLDHVASGARVLDVGCAEGDFAAALHEAGAHPVGVDVAREPLRRAAQRHPGLALRLWPALQPLPAADDEFDAAWAGEVIEHVVDTPGWLAEVRRALRRGGLLLLTTPAHPRALRLRLALSDRAFEEHFSVRADHLRFFTARALRALLADLGFDDVHVARDGPTLLARARRG